VTGSALPRPLPFEGVEELEGRPHVVVDGGARPSTVLSLSHWPGSVTPRALARDLSAEIAFAYLRSPGYWRDDAEAVTNDHVDQDGLVSIYVLSHPGPALDHEHVLVEVARVGDFAVERDDAALAISLALRELADAARGARIDAGSPAGRRAETAALLDELVGRLPELLRDPERARALCAAELAAVDAGRRALAAGDVTVEGPGQAGVATVVVDERVQPVAASRFFDAIRAPVHPVVVHSATDAVRVLLAHGRHYRYYDRYETWVRFTSAQLPRRRALPPLAEILDAEESGGARWRADPPGALEPSLEVEGESSIELSRLGELISSYLLDAPVAWDPDARSGALAGASVSGPGAPRAGTTGRGRLRSRGRRRERPSA